MVSNASGLDYTSLKKLCKSGNWKAADEETARMVLAVAGRTEQGYLNLDDIKNFPCEDLRIIDALWVKCSNGRFGFSVQKQIYINCGGKLDGIYDATVWYRFADEVGWLVNGKCLDYNYCQTFSPIIGKKGHLPLTMRFISFSRYSRYDYKRLGGVVFLSRAKTCNP